METLIQSHQLGKSYGRFRALMGVDLQLQAGQVLGLLGHNGAGKSTLIKSVLGSHSYDGELHVFGLEPQAHRVSIVRDLAYISDAALLPEWMTVKQIIQYMAGLHPKFDATLAYEYLAQTDIQSKVKIAKLSKGMKVQLHLALIMSSHARVLILDEPTLGLDLLFRERFYQQLMAWFKAGDRALIIASHEVNEIAHMLTDVLMLKQGKVVCAGTLDEVTARYAKVAVPADKMKMAETAKPIYVQQEQQGMTAYFDQARPEKLATLGEVSCPTLAEIFIAVQQGA